MVDLCDPLLVGLYRVQPAFCTRYFAVPLQADAGGSGRAARRCTRPLDWPTMGAVHVEAGLALLSEAPVATVLCIW